MKHCYLLIAKAFVLLLLTLQSPILFAKGGPVSASFFETIQLPTTGDWLPLVATPDISIFYRPSENPCVKYELKIVNHSTTEKVVNFGIMGTVTKRECVQVCGTQFRTFNVAAGQTLEASADATGLYVPNVDENLTIDQIIQNLNVQ